MINVSKEFEKLMQSNTDFKEYAEITLQNGTVLTLSEEHFTVSNNNIVDGANYNGLPLGAAVSKHIQIELMNDKEQYSEYDFFGAKIRLYLTYKLSSTVERVEKGTFTVITPETYGTTVIISAIDDMYKAEKAYSTSLIFPSTINAMLRDVCDECDILLKSTSFNNDNFVINSMPEGDYTFRQIISYIAMISGGNARIDRYGYLEIKQYDMQASEFIRNYLNGGSYVPWNGDSADGGSFAPWNTGDSYDGGTYDDRNNFHILKNWKSLKVDTDDVVITGVKAVVDDVEYMYGVDGYVLSVDNPLIVGHEQEIVNYLGNIYVGMQFRRFNGDLIANPLIEFMDAAIIFDRKGNMYSTYITDVDFSFFGFTVLKNSADSVIRNSSRFYSDATKTLVKARELITKEKNARELAVEQLANQLANSSGLYMTTEEQQDGSFIYYMHDKPTQAESMVIWKLTALAFGISTDGGKTYPYGFTVDGTTITRLLYAEGIDADYIDTGAIRITDTAGNTMFLADYDTKQVYINADNVKIGSKKITDELTAMSSNITLNANSINAEVKRAQGQEVELAAAISINADNINLKVSKGSVSSEISAESGQISIKSNRFVLESTNCSISADGKIKAKDVDLTGKITASSGSIGGFTVSSSSIYNGKTSLSSSVSGVYIGTDGISVGYGVSQPAFSITSSGEIIIAATGGINFNSLGASGGYAIKLPSVESKIGIQTYSYIDFSSTKIQLYSASLIVGAYGKRIGFFGDGGSIKQNVSTVSTLSDLSTTVSKLNELINALKAYNLI